MQDSYRELFLSESQEYLGNISNCLVKLENKPADLESINEIFRCIHTLKGMSATMGYEKLTQLSHHMEDLLDELRSQKRSVTTQIMDVLFSSVDALSELIEDLKANRESSVDVQEYIDLLNRTLAIESPIKEPLEGKKKKNFNVQSDVINFSEAELTLCKEKKHEGFNLFKIRIQLASDCVMRESRVFLVITNLKKTSEIIKTIPAVEELEKGNFGFSFAAVISTKEKQNSIRQEILKISEIEEVDMAPFEVALISASSAVTPTYIKKIQNMRIPVERLDKIMNLIGELSIARIRLTQLITSYKIEEVEEVGFLLESLVSALQGEIMQTRLLPVSYILDTFPRMVRDMAKKEGKEVNLEIVGSDIELDRVVLDEIGDPLVHLIRNSIDHGIESPKERKANGKSQNGRLLIRVTRQKGQIAIEVNDDGRGVDFEAVKKTALSKGLITEDDSVGFDERRVLDMISLPGFSTSEKITDISGRGVGLDVVRSKIEAMGGRLDFETKLGMGSSFILSLPLTLAIIKAMLIRVCSEVFAVPLMNIRETIKVNREEIKVLQNLEVIRVREEIIPIIRLEKEFSILLKDRNADSSGFRDDRIAIVIVEYGKNSMGLLVSQVMGEQDIVVKPLSNMIKRTRGIAGATILGDGRVALILDIMSLK